MAKKIQGSQRDFSFGEVDADLKRSDDHPARKGGLRQMKNMRIHNSKTMQNRSGRRALYPIADGGLRTERFTISPGNVFDIQFAANRLKIINANGATVGNFTAQGNGAALPWTSTAHINSIVYAIFGLTITVTFAGMRPQVVTFDGVSGWSMIDYAETVTPGGQKRTPFYRISPQNVTLKLSATTGIVNMTFSSAVLVAGHVGTRMRFCGRQLTIQTVTSPKTGTAAVNETLPPGQQFSLTATVGVFNIGDAVIGNSSGAEGIVTTTPNQQLISFAFITFFIFPVGDAVIGGTSGATGIVVASDFSGTMTVALSTGTLFQAGENIAGPHGAGSNIAVSGGTMNVQLLQSIGRSQTFVASEIIVAPAGTATISTVTTIAPQPVAIWDDEVINPLHGFPASCFADQFRLGFCNFPSIPGGIAWSAINNTNDLYIGATADEAMFEIAPKKVQVYFVVPGPESNEFVFSDRGIFYIPISPTNPLRPGSVQFLTLSGDGAAQVQPRLAQEAIIYVNAGGNSMMAVIATGAYLRPFNTRSLTDFHAHLFNAIQCIAAPNADGTFNERYAYILNGDGSITVGKYDAGTLQSENVPTIGWGPWSGAAAVTWIGAYASDVIFTSKYFNAGIVEILDDSQYLDCALLVNAAPAAFAPAAGAGPLWFIASQTVSLMDQGTRSMGTYKIDANGFIVPQFNGGENLAIASLVAGQPWTWIAEPFADDATPGADQHQRMTRRRISYFSAYMIHSTGFVMARLFSSRTTSTSPINGAVVNQRRFPAYNVDDDATKPPPQREITERTRPPGWSFDPRVAVLGDTPGPVQIMELGMEISI